MWYVDAAQINAEVDPGGPEAEVPNLDYSDAFSTELTPHELERVLTRSRTRRSNTGIVDRRIPDYH